MKVPENSHATICMGDATLDVVIGNTSVMLDNGTLPLVDNDRLGVHAANPIHARPPSSDKLRRNANY